MRRLVGSHTTLPARNQSGCEFQRLACFGQLEGQYFVSRGQINGQWALTDESPCKHQHFSIETTSGTGDDKTGDLGRLAAVR